MMNTIESLIHHKYAVSNENTYDGFDEGLLELSTLKEIRFGNNYMGVDLNVICKRYLLRKEQLSVDKHCLTVVYGNALAENKIIVFIFPPGSARSWRRCLKQIMQGLIVQRSFIDRMMYWLKEQYTKLFYAFKHGPSAAPVVRIFGGRRWSVTGMNIMHTQQSPATSRRPAVNFGPTTVTTIKRIESGSDSEAKSPASKIASALRSAKRHFGTSRHSSNS